MRLSKTLEIVKDESREVYFRSVLDTWNAADGGDPAKRSQAALKSLDAYEESLRSEEPKDEFTRTGKDGVEVLLSPSKHKRRIQSTKRMEERVLSELNFGSSGVGAAPGVGESMEAGKDPSETKGEQSTMRSSMRKTDRDAALQAIMDLRNKALATMNESTKPKEEEA